MSTLSRREVLRSAALVPLAAAVQTRRPHVAVVGAGAFGGWTALHLRRRGHDVTLLDAYGPGNSRASSAGGETRVIRASYGARTIYTNMVARALPLWREQQARWTLSVLHEIGVLQMGATTTENQRLSMTAMQDAGLPFEQMDGRQAQRRFPQFSFDGLDSMVLEKAAGYLSSRLACQSVARTVVAEGGRYVTARAAPGPVTANRMREVGLSDGSTLQADVFVFACGPWLGSIFPREIGSRIQPARQMGLFFGVPAGAALLHEDKCPVWLEAAYYGIPGNDYRGFKIVGGTLGDRYDPQNPWNPDSSERVVPAERVVAPRAHLERRFPALRGAPLLESFVCQYENSPDEHLILDRLPGTENVWIAGGGSGHGFKFCPAVGEMMAHAIVGKTPLPAALSFARFGPQTQPG
jgi:glycine/D-amino acid oxidase-like deaminating enzyme